MKEAYHCRKEFDKKKGWTPKKVQSLLSRLKHCFIPMAWSGEDGPSLFGMFCSIDLEEFNKACEDLPHLREKGARAVCAEIITGLALMRLPQDPDKPPGHRDGTVSIMFDVNERFFPSVDKAWKQTQRKPKGKRGPLDMISSIDTVGEGAKKSPALQAADYLAWHVNRWLTKNCDTAYWRAIMASGPVHGVIADYEKLSRWYRKGETNLLRMQSLTSLPE